MDPDRSITRIICERQLSFCLSPRNGIRNLTNEGAVPPDDTIVHAAMTRIKRNVLNNVSSFFYTFHRYCAITDT
jgi:hypothetical protein